MDIIMKLDELKTIFETGALINCSISPVPMQEGLWMLTVQGKKKDVCYTMTAKRSGDEPRAFKTTDAAISAAKQIGFRKLNVHL